MEIVLSISAIVLSFASLVWQLVTHRFNGDRVVVELGTSIPVGAAFLPTCRAITAMNRGRTAVTVNTVALDVGHGSAAQIVPHLVHPLSDPLPCRLEPGASATWAYPIEIDRQVLAGHPRRRAAVSLATGRRRLSKKA